MYSSENELLLTCAGTNPGDKSAHEINAILNCNLNWTYIIRNASRHAVAPLLYKSLKILDAEDRIPKDMFETLRKHYYFTAARNMQIYDNLSRFLKIINDKGIKVIVLKGAILAETVYRDIGLRPMGDIDILIQHGDKEMVCKNIGLKRVKGMLFSFNPGVVEKSNDKTKIEDALYDIHVNIHGRGLPLRETITKKLWEDAIPVRISGVSALKLCPEHELLHLIVHGDYFLKLLWLCDIAELVRSHNGIMDWQKVINNAKQYGYKNIYFFQLLSARMLLDAPVPDDVLLQLRPNKFKTYLVKRIIKEWKPNLSDSVFLNLSKPVKIHIMEYLSFLNVHNFKRLFQRRLFRVP